MPSVGLQTPGSSLVPHRAPEQTRQVIGGRRAGRELCYPLLPAGELYLLSRVLHDWDDDSAVTILARCREFMETAGCLHIVELNRLVF